MLEVVLTLTDENGEVDSLLDYFNDEAELASYLHSLKEVGFTDVTVTRLSEE